MGEDGMGAGGKEGLEDDNLGGDTSKGVGGMVVSIAFDTQFCLVVMTSEVMESWGQPRCHLHL